MYCRWMPYWLPSPSSASKRGVSVGVEMYFFHVNNVVDDISVNDIVTFDLERGDRGLSAVNVCLENK